MSDGETAAVESRAAVRMLASAVEDITRTVERTHQAVSRRSFRPWGHAARPAERIHDSIAELVYGGVQAGTRLAGTVAGQTAATAGRSHQRGRLVDSPAGRTAIGVLTGMLGELSDLPAVEMTLRRDGAAVSPDRCALEAAYPEHSAHLAVFLHGLVETERWWFRPDVDEQQGCGTDFGTRLERDLGYTSLYLRYHSGRHISDNARDLDELLTRIMDNWPVPVASISLIGHSMGGLVARSAVHQAWGRGAPWVPNLSHLICLGSPHRGAPLEMGAHLLVRLMNRFSETEPLSTLVDARSDGIKDLRYGYLHEHEWAGYRRADGTRSEPLFDTRPRTPAHIPAPVRQHFFTATIGRDQHGILARSLGDALVTPASSYDHAQGAWRHWFGGLHHFDLLHHDAVYTQLARSLRQPD